ncbi:S41 family peptidase [Aceticella autotrophica]|uniref:S41 family peptidase n=1 Tax=Aceticella autotrophica TaxID=2755338 RepID=A0A975AV74_9THEO|nr:S41 family peptidase [Aceticella autotrophica]QSZ27061.1 S41 family peptidase [Aceticella autotrophica]
MKKFLSFLLAVIISISLTIYIPVNAYADTNQTQQSDKELYKNLSEIGEVMQYIKENYPGNITYDQMKDAALKGILSSLDKYSEYFSSSDLNAFQQSVSGVFSGVGMVIQQNPDGKFVVISTIEGSPAEKAGIKSGYVIKAVDGKDVKGMDINDVVDLIKGKTGTKVKIVFEVNGIDKEYEFTREVIKINPVFYKIINGIGYIRINEFNNNTTENVKKALDYMDSNNVKKIVLDLRDNPGGMFEEAVNVANFFVPEGVVVSVATKNGKDEKYYSNLKKTKYKLAVLINGGTASAAEILAGAIQDTKTGILIGEKSYGKGTVQVIVQLSDGGGLKLTVAKYKLPSGRCIDGVGLMPDIKVLNKSGDNQLNKALEILK